MKKYDELSGLRQRLRNASIYILMWAWVMATLAVGWDEWIWLYEDIRDWLHIP